MPGTGHRIVQNPRDQFGQGTTIEAENGGEYRGDEAAGIASERANDVKEHAQYEAERQRQDVQQNVLEDDADPEVKKGRLHNKLSAVKVSASSPYCRKAIDTANIGQRSSTRA